MSACLHQAGLLTCTWSFSRPYATCCSSRDVPRPIPHLSCQPCMPEAVVERSICSAGFDYTPARLHYTCNYASNLDSRPPAACHSHDKPVKHRYVRQAACAAASVSSPLAGQGLQPSAACTGDCHCSSCACLCQAQANQHGSIDILWWLCISGLQAPASSAKRWTHTAASSLPALDNYQAALYSCGLQAPASLI